MSGSQFKAPGFAGGYLRHDFGAGPDLYASGQFTEIGGVSANHIARWDGDSWAPLGSGLTGRAEVLYSFDLAGRYRIIVGGRFISAGGISVGRVAAWNGVEWEAIGFGADDNVEGIGEYDHPVTGERVLIIGGRFTNTDGNIADGAAYWTGAEWNALYTEQAIFENQNDHQAWTFEWADPGGDGQGARLFTGGWITQTGSPIINNVLEIDDGVVSGMNGGTNNTVHTLLSTDIFTENELLFVGGQYSTAGTVSTGPFAAWDGDKWIGFGPLTSNGTVIKDIAVFDDGSDTGAAVFAGGNMNCAWLYRIRRSQTGLRCWPQRFDLPVRFRSSCGFGWHRVLKVSCIRRKGRLIGCGASSR